jgi:hypothetical protein
VGTTTIESLRESVRGEVIGQHGGLRRGTADNDANVKWVWDYYDAVAPLSEEGGYVNFMSGDDQDRIKANYKGNYDRLTEVKRNTTRTTCST